MRLILPLLMALLFAGCPGAEAPGKTPEETFGSLVRLVEGNDRPGIHALLTKEAQAEVAERIANLKGNLEKGEISEGKRAEAAEIIGMPLEEFVELPLPEAFALACSTEEIMRDDRPKLAMLEGATFVEAVPTGETRTRVRFAGTDGKPAAAEVILVLEDGLWKLPEMSHILVPAPGSGSGKKERVICMNNLMQIGGLFLARRATEGWDTENGGSAFLLQVRDMIEDEDLSVFLCPGDPATRGLLEDPAGLTALFRGNIEDAPCGYRGPNRAFLEDRTKGSGYILACCRNGPSGEDPWHGDGVCVLYDSGKVDFIAWKDMEGYEGGPVQVGHGSPDPRFTHLAD